MKQIELIKIFANDLIGAIVLLGDIAYQYEGKNENGTYNFLNTRTLKTESLSFTEKTIWQNVVLMGCVK
jgi:hypothetical protein